jgi:hypothetical protein
MKKSLLPALLILSALYTLGQNEIDNLRYSFNEFGLTARSMGLGGAIGAPGADIGALEVNAAGIGKFTRSQLLFSPNFRMHRTNSNIHDINSTAGDSKLNIANIGFIHAKKIEDSPYTKWKYRQFGIVYHKTHVYDQRLRMEGLSSTSMMDDYVDRALGYTEDELADYFNSTTNLAYQTYVVDPHPTQDSAFVHNMRFGDVYQRRTIGRDGFQRDWTFSLSGNYDNKLLVGASFSLPRIEFTEQYQHRENKEFDTTATDISNYTAHYTQISVGRGYKGNLGIIYMGDNFRIGVAYHTGTYYRFQDEWVDSMEANFDNGDYYSYSSTGGQFTYFTYAYNVQTPAKYVISGAYLNKKFGLISADVEYIDYRNARLISRNNNFPDEYNYANETSEIIYRGTFNIRVGAEYRLFPELQIRAGVSNYGNPFKSEYQEYNSGRTYYSGGVGYRGDYAFIDLGFSYMTSSESYYMYNPNYISDTQIDNRNTRIMLTAGLIF